MRITDLATWDSGILKKLAGVGSDEPDPSSLPSWKGHRCCGAGSMADGDIGGSVEGCSALAMSLPATLLQAAGWLPHLSVPESLSFRSAFLHLSPADTWASVAQGCPRQGAEQHPCLLPTRCQQRAPHHTLVTIQNFSRNCQVSPRKQTQPWLRATLKKVK